MTTEERLYQIFGQGQNETTESNDNLGFGRFPDAIGLQICSFQETTQRARGAIHSFTSEGKVVGSKNEIFVSGFDANPAGSKLASCNRLHARCEKMMQSVQDYQGEHHEEVLAFLEFANGVNQILEHVMSIHNLFDPTSSRAPLQYYTGLACRTALGAIEQVQNNFFYKLDEGVQKVQLEIAMSGVKAAMNIFTKAHEASSAVDEIQ